MSTVRSLRPRTLLSLALASFLATAAACGSSSSTPSDGGGTGGTAGVGAGGAGGSVDGGAGTGGSDAGSVDGTVGVDGPMSVGTSNGGDIAMGICNSNAVPCNNVGNLGQTVTRTVDAGPVPPLAGGPLVDGTYVLTAIVQYMGDATEYTLKQTSVFAGGLDNWVSSINGAAEGHFTAAFSAGTSLSLSVCCPVSVALDTCYAASGNTLQVLDPQHKTRVFTFTRQ